jgi:hypothetical protein
VPDNDAYALQRSDLNRFLFADVGVEASGMTLSVLSALARRGVDPWQEAGRLAKLPQSAAIDILARIIAAMPSNLWSMADATEIAKRLVALLPTRSTVITAPAPAQALQSAKSLLNGRLLTHRWSIVAAMAGAVMIGVLVNMAMAPSNHPVSTEMSGFSAAPPAAK